MSAYFEKIPLSDDELFIIREFEVPYMSYPLHFHPEIEITYIRKSYGQRFVGDYIEEFTDGDLVMIGTNLPHQWQNDPYFREGPDLASLSVIHFRGDVFGEKLPEIREFDHIKNMLAKAERGLKFGKHTARDFESRLDTLCSSNVQNRFVDFIQLLDVLASCDEMEVLSSQKLKIDSKDPLIDRINHVYSYMLDHFDQDITLSQVSESVQLSDSAFSHFIKKKTGKTFSQLLNDLRINYARKLLTQSDLHVGEICYRIGYRNLSYFNRQFRDKMHCSPSQYRKRYKEEYLSSYRDHPDLQELSA